MIELINGDCMDYMRGIPDKSFDLCIADPPYGINVNTNMGRRKGDKKSDYHKFAGNDLCIPSKEYFDEMFRVSKNQIIWGGNYMTEFLKPSSCWIVWYKMFSEDVTFATFEMAWTSFTSSSKMYQQSPNKKDRIHPTQKPVKLYEWILTRYSTKGDKIFDPFLGSGSSAIAADLLGFDFVGIELDKDYFEAAKLRLENHQRQLKIF